ncbi:hypothetical protein AAF712_013022 [Marasmius tenuissimus]|uniref:Uncharacterized protein n=1 Tax=Marasmius tenuissimus TaxID=585030 RepID=A0ABR2ZFS1_9AGAR
MSTFYFQEETREESLAAISGRRDDSSVTEAQARIQMTSSTSSSLPTTSIKRTESTMQSKIPVFYPEKCLSCGNHSHVKNSDAYSRLTSFLNIYASANDSLQPFLEYFGIFHIGHLKQLFSLSDEEVKWVLQGCKNISGEDAGNIATSVHKHLPDVGEIAPADPNSIHCERHRGNSTERFDKMPHKLQSLLTSKGMEFLIPVAFFYGLQDDYNLEGTLASARNPSVQWLLPEYANVTDLLSQTPRACLERVGGL